MLEFALVNSCLIESCDRGDFVSHSRIGVLVVQLGTPEAPTAKAVRPYLRQFLSDMRVIDYSPFIWQPILRGIILNTRPRKSARLYARIWTEEGSPLLIYSQRQVEGLAARLGDGYRVILGMTYGSPSVGEAMATLEAEGIDRIIVLPMYPQYASTTTASVYDAVYRAAAGRRCPLFHERKRHVPTLRFVPPYYDHPGYIEALRVIIADALAAWPHQPDKVIFSYHGNPIRYTRTGDPYQQQAEATTARVVEALGLPDDAWMLTYQSQFGPEKWLGPATDETLEELAEAGARYVAVACPGFTADCLETLDEIGNEAHETFCEHGGADLLAIPCLNDHPLWLDAMADIVRTEAGGWDQRSVIDAAGVAR